MGRRGGGGVEIGAITAEHVIVIRMLLKRDNLYWRILRPGSFNQIIRDNEEDSVEAVEAGLYSKSDSRVLPATPQSCPGPLRPNMDAFNLTTTSSLTNTTNRGAVSQSRSLKN